MATRRAMNRTTTNRSTRAVLVNFVFIEFAYARTTSLSFIKGTSEPLIHKGSRKQLAQVVIYLLLYIPESPD